ncbi:MAG: Ig-like domain-containing domain [Algoriphagus sp.]|nr:Ig-like domain-containing domain [Algoriphagus sp.]
MKLFNSFILVLFTVLAAACAKQSTPMGGPRDEDPPRVIEMLPANQSVNIKPEDILITFDEYIELDNAAKNIIITPRINKDEIEITALKNTLSIILNQELEDSTTYVFNFQKSVADLSEGNPVENLKLVFSTGNTIDSLSFSGNVNYYFPDEQDKFEDIIIGIYPASDTTNVFTAQPYYLSETDSTGKFIINNIKPGNYKAYAWRDDNSNLKAEFKTEAFDFILDTISIQENIENVIFNLAKGDQTPIKLTRSAVTGRNYDLIFNKEPEDIKLTNEELGKSIFYSTGDKRIKLYSKSARLDSLLFTINIKDSVGYQVDTTIWAKFPESERKPEKITISANSGKSFYQTLPIELTFNKPLSTIKTDSLFITYDTASRIQIMPEMLSFEDSLRRTKLLLKIPIPDSIAFEIFTIKAADSTFFDIEDQFNEKEFTANYKKLKRDALADAVSGRIEGTAGPFIVQLLNAKGEINREIFLTNQNTFQFLLVEPGTYRIRVIIDTNNNKRWDPSNFSEGRYAEQVFYFTDPATGKKEIILRGGWTLEDQNIPVPPKTGIPNQEKSSVDN